MLLRVQYICRTGRLFMVAENNFGALAKVDPEWAGWSIVGQMRVSGAEVLLADHPATDGIDRTFVRDRMQLCFLVAPQRNPTRGWFPGTGSGARPHPLGNIVFVPAHRPIHVQAEAVPLRRLLTCTLPSRQDFDALAASDRLEHCLDLRSDLMQGALSRLAVELMAPSFASAVIVEGLCLYLVGELAAILAGETGGRGAPAVRAMPAHVDRRAGGLAPWQLRRIEEHLMAGNWDSRLTDLAALCGISSRHIMRAFRQSTGSSLTQYIAAARVDRARALLKNENLTIAEVGRELRFATPSSFTTAFRRQFGMTPRTYRQFHRDVPV